MKKVMFVIFGIFLLALTLGSVFAETCVDCCNGSECTGNSANSSTLDIEDCLVRINDRTVKNDVTILKAFERGQDLEIRVEFASFQDADDVQVMAFITGYHRGSKLRDNIFDITSTFDVEEDVSYEKTLNLVLPDDFKLESGDELKLRIEISDKYSHSYIREYNLKVEAQENNVIIQDIVLDPAEKVEAGRGLFANVRIKNMGEDTEESIKVTASIPALQIKATQYVDELDNDEATTTEDMFLRIPSCATPGDYKVNVVVEYAEGDETVEGQSAITVLEDPSCQLSETPAGKDEKTIITIPGKQDVIIGTSGTVYPIIIENKGVTSRSYELKVSGLDSWATYRFDPGAYLILDAGETQTAYLYVTPKQDAPTGEKIFMASIETAGDKKQVALSANVIEGQKESPLNGLDFGSLGQGLTIGLIILVVLIVILGLVIGFNKMKGNEEGPEKEDISSGQTYY